jgi:hypothetical protein
VIFGHAELAMDEIDSGHYVYTSLQEILSAAQRANDVTRQLLAFARKQTIATKRLNLNVCRRYMESLSKTKELLRFTAKAVLDEGMNFIQKPFSKNDLSQKVREILGPQISEIPYYKTKGARG